MRLACRRAGKSVQNLAPIQLEGGTEETLGVDYGKTFIAAVPKGTALSQIKISFTPSDDVKTEDGKVKAPVKAGQTVGTLNFEMPGENLGYVDGKDHGTVEALAAFDVENSNVVTEGMRGAKGFIGQMVQKVQDFFGGIWSKIQKCLLTRKFELGFLLKRLALFTRDVYNFRQMIQYE